MSSTTLVPVEEYLKRTEKPNAEYLDGVVRPKATPTKSHSAIQYLLVGMLRCAGLEAYPELTVRLSSTKYLVPDVAAALRIEDPYPTDPVLLCVEILSPEDRLGAMLAKCEQYHNWGVPYCWVIDAAKLAAWEYPANGEPSRHDQTGTLSAGNISLALSDVFAALNRK